ncbi:BolA family transcriptional regulator [Pacificimonas sp. WHA3]|uniref:BolA family transcriptional regulator n=1 Tax=Pacificimonas pallii TaxID=2827236 RepID=A0ABS6SGJ5_9SPHN|nr:BolA family protein [Pacificimonas pallii]MBV7257515.1 BolA family transcriptional regulator [Pacificimonas pallii]
MSAPQTVAAEIERRLRDALSPTSLTVINESEQHLGHAGHDGSGESHFAVEITAPAFAGQSRVARQRAIYAALGGLMDNPIHALRIKAEAE